MNAFGSPADAAGLEMVVATRDKPVVEVLEVVEVGAVGGGPPQPSQPPQPAFRRAPGVTRTPGQRFRKPLLYPPELQGRVRGRKRPNLHELGVVQQGLHVSSLQ